MGDSSCGPASVGDGFWAEEETKVAGEEEEEGWDDGLPATAGSPVFTTASRR